MTARAMHNDPKGRPRNGDSDVPDARGVRLGEAIRTLRKGLGFTLKDIAGLTGLSHPFLSQVERGQAQPSMASLYQISEALGTSASWLLSSSNDSAEASIIRASDSMSVPNFEKDFLEGVTRTVVPETTPYQVVEATGLPTRWHDHWTHEGFETIYVIRGHVLLELDGEIFGLMSADSISYDSALPHRFRSDSAEETQMLIIEATPGPLRRSGPNTAVIKGASTH